MKENEIRAALEGVRRDLERNKQEHDSLEQLQRGFEGLLRLQSGKSSAQLRLSDIGAAVASNLAKVGVGIAGVSFRSAVLNTLKDAKGEQLHTKEILRRVLERGANTTAKDPHAITDLMCYSLSKTEPIMKSAPRTWRYGTKAEWEAWRRHQAQVATNKEIAAIFDSPEFNPPGRSE